MRVQAVKRAQAGFGDFLADSGVSRLKGKCDDNKEVYWLYDRLCGLVVRVSGYRYRGPGFDPRRYQIF